MKKILLLSALIVNALLLSGCIATIQTAST